MNTVSFRLDNYPRFMTTAHLRYPDAEDWIEIFKLMGYNIKWNHYALGKKFIEMNDEEFMWFALRYS